MGPRALFPKIQWAMVAAALLLSPSAAMAQQAAGRAPDRTVSPAIENQGTTARSVTPAVPAERVRSEAATTPKPVLDPEDSLAPAGTVTTGGEAGTSRVLQEAADPEPLPPMKPTPRVGQPDGGWNLQDQVTPIGVQARHFNDNILLPLMAVVTLIVFVLLLFAMVRFRAKTNPVPSKTAHHTLIEVAWTVVPVLILVWLAVPSFRLLADQYDPPKPDLTIKATGHQWYWEYEYPDHGFSFDQIMLTEQESEARGEPRLLAVDNRVVVPAGAVVKVLTTSADVIHSWGVPSFWVKMDAVPGRVNETWFKVDRPGVYYGHCYELCGTKHAFMPITVEVAEPARFNAWASIRERENGVETLGPRFARGADGRLIRVANQPAAAAATTAPQTATAE